MVSRLELTVKTAGTHRSSRRSIAGRSRGGGLVNEGRTPVFTLLNNRTNGLGTGNLPGTHAMARRKQRPGSALRFSKLGTLREWSVSGNDGESSEIRNYSSRPAAGRRPR